jgi:hypothetical protein
MSTQHHYSGKHLQLKKHNCTSTSLIERERGRKGERERERERAATDLFYVSFQLLTAVTDKLLVFYQVSATCSG